MFPISSENIIYPKVPAVERVNVILFASRLGNRRLISTHFIAHVNYTDLTSEEISGSACRSGNVWRIRPDPISEWVGGRMLKLPQILDTDVHAAIQREVSRQARMGEES